MSNPSSAPNRRKHTHNPHAHSTKLTTPTTKGTSTSTLKKKVRDLERLLSNPKTNLPADVRIDSERALEAFKHELNLAKGSAREVKMAKKYHMVRFFERQKASRKLKQLQRQLTAESPPESLKTDIHNAEVDLNYILHYPRGEKYISLFKDPGKEVKVVEKRDMIKKDIERQMARGTLGSATADSMDVDDEVGEEGEPVQKKRESGREKRKRKKVEEAAVEEDGFFEF